MPADPIGVAAPAAASSASPPIELAPATPLAGLPSLARPLPDAGRRITLAPLPGAADALALAQLGRSRRRAEAHARDRLRGRAVRAAPGRRDRLVRARARLAFFPDWETLPYDQFSPHQDLVSERLATLYQMHARRVRRRDRRRSTTALYRLRAGRVPRRRARSSSSRASKLDGEELRAQLTLAGYAHVTQVVAPGEYSFRGGLIDLFPMGSALPYRIDLFDDEIETHPHLRRRHAAHASTR